MKKLDRLLNKMADEAFKKTGLTPTYGFILLILKEKMGYHKRISPNYFVLHLQRLLVLSKNWNTKAISKQSVMDACH